MKSQAREYLRPGIFVCQGNFQEKNIALSINRFFIKLKYTISKDSEQYLKNYSLSLVPECTTVHLSFWIFLKCFSSNIDNISPPTRGCKGMENPCNADVTPFPL